MKTIKLTENYEVEILWNDKTSFSKIFFVDTREHIVYREVGIVLTYFDDVDGEIFNPHWRGECYLSEKHFGGQLIDSLFSFLLENTQVKEPFLLQVNKGERTHGAYREIGQLTQQED